MGKQTPGEVSKNDSPSVAANVAATYVSKVVGGIVAIVAFAFTFENLPDKYFLPVGLPIIAVCTLVIVVAVRRLMLGASKSNADES